MQSIRDPRLRDFFSLCLSACVGRVSLADPRISVPVRLRSDRYPTGHRLRSRVQQLIRARNTVDVESEFFAIVRANGARVAALASAVGPRSAKVSLHDDVRNIGANGDVSRGTIDVAITSPPYAGAQKYIRASSLSLGWLELCGVSDLSKLERASIGREHFGTREYGVLPQTSVPDADEFLAVASRTSPLRACIAATYLVEMRAALRSIVSALKPGGLLIMVVADNSVCGQRFRTGAYLQQLAQSLSLDTELVLRDRIRSRMLLTKRNSAALPIDCEEIYLLRNSGAIDST